MKSLKNPLLLSGVLLLLAGCAGTPNSSGAPAAAQKAAPGAKPTPPRNMGFTFNTTAPHANPLAFDAADEAQDMVSPQGHRDGAGVFVYATRAGRAYALLARRAPWLGGHGTWGAFGGSVEKTDLDATGTLSYARAAEHELYEESVTVFHQTDANDLRACPSHLKHWRSGLRFRTFFSKQAFLPAKRFNEGYAYAVKHNLKLKFRENDEFRWVPLEAVKASGRANTRTCTYVDKAGLSQTINLFPGFFAALREPGYLAVLDTL